MWHEFNVLSSERMTLSCGEVRKRHLMCAADLGIHVVNLSSKSVRRKPLTHGVWFQECSIYPLGGRTQDAVKPDCIRGHSFFSSRITAQHNESCQNFPMLKPSVVFRIAPQLDKRLKKSTCGTWVHSRIGRRARRRHERPKSASASAMCRRLEAMQPPVLLLLQSSGVRRSSMWSLPSPVCFVCADTPHRATGFRI